ncbi:MAG: GbsR/MarR family transcriptional regulator [Stackebrandtia sp.]
MHTGRTPLHDYADEIGLYFESHGLPRIPGRILGWLLVCEPPHQSAEELAEALSVSRGSISMAVNSGIRSGFVVRHPVPGQRRTYYRLRPGFWLNEASEKAKVARDWVKSVDRGLDLLEDAPPERRRRLEEAREMYTFLAEQYARIETLWHERQKE